MQSGFGGEVIQKKRILLAEDHTLFRAGMVALLSREPDVEVVGEADNGKEVVKLAAVLSPDLILMDLNMPGTNGLEAIGQIRKRYAAMRILIVTMHRNEEYVHETMRAGANGYLLKSATHDELLVAVRSVLSGKTYLSPDIASQVIHKYLGGGYEGTSRGWDSLTLRERQVLKLIGEGRQNREISRYLSLSVKTVEKHRSNLMRKLDLHNSSTVTAFAIQRGLVETQTGQSM
jgi:DNA-binding NarL/FixJ family response regulator